MPDIIIRDPLLEPFFIVQTDLDFALMETVTPKVKYTETGGKPYVKTRSYHPTIRSIMVRIVRIQNQGKEKYESLREYIEEKEELNKKIEELIAKFI
jgi:hypothetical protein